MNESIALDKKNDTYLDEYGNIAIVSGVLAIQQNVKSAVRLWRGESDFDDTKGVQYCNILGEQLDDILLRDELETAILGVDGVSRVISLDYITDNQVRKYTVNVRYELFTGEVINESI